PYNFSIATPPPSQPYTLSLHDALPISSRDRTLTVVAHELTHALDFMQWVVPAFQDWDAFCQHANEFGSTAAEILEHLEHPATTLDRKSTRLNSSHRTTSYAVFCLKKKK